MSSILRALLAGFLLFVGGLLAFILALAQGGDDDVISREGSYVGLVVMLIAATCCLLVASKSDLLLRALFAALLSLVYWTAVGGITNEVEAGVTYPVDAMPRLNLFVVSIFIGTAATIALTPLATLARKERSALHDTNEHE